MRHYHLPIGSPIVAHPYQRHPRQRHGGGGRSFESSREPSAPADTSNARTLARGVLDKAKAVEPRVSPILQRVAADNGGEMAGFDNRLKKEDSLTRKIHDKSVAKGLTEEEYAARIGDALRYTMVLPDESFSDGAQSVMDSFGDAFEIKDVENSFLPDNLYKGLHMTLVDSDTGLATELQLHTPASIAAKGPSHKLFEQIRLPETPPEQGEQMKQQMKQIWDAVPEPAGVTAFGTPFVRKRRGNIIRKRPGQSPVHSLYVLQ